MKYLFHGAKIVSPFEIQTGDVLVENGKIMETGTRFGDLDDVTLIDATGLCLAPGFVDLHVHGGSGVNPLSGKAGDVLQMARAHAMHGTTSIVPTLYTSPLDKMLVGARAIIDAMNAPGGKTIAGIHFEGPFLAPSQAGAQLPEALTTPPEANLEGLREIYPWIRMFGMAPELPGTFELAEEMAARGITVSIAHSDADYDTVTEAIRHGFSDVTHLYSSCSTIHRVKGFRVAGVVEAGLERNELTVQAIADGCHLPASLLRLIWHCKGPDAMYLITDGLETSVSEIREGEVYLQSNGIEAVCEDGVMKLMDRLSFAGSIAGTDRLLRVACQAGIPMTDVVRMMTDTPARRIGLQTKGRICRGYDADLVLFDSDYNVCFVMAGGEILRDERRPSGK